MRVRFTQTFELTALQFTAQNEVRLFMGMNMRHWWVVAASFAALTGCQMQPKELTGSFEMAGNYKAVADCSYLLLRADNANMWRKDDLSSQNKVMVTLGVNESTVGQIDFIGTSPDRTRVEVRFPNKVWVEKLRKQFTPCAA